MLRESSQLHRRGDRLFLAHNPLRMTRPNQRMLAANRVETFPISPLTEISPLTKLAYSTHVLADGSAERVSCERSLASAGVRLPLPHRAGWPLARRGVQSRSVALRAADGRWAAAFGVDAVNSRALPGFRLLRVERFGEALPQALLPNAVDALAALGRRDPRVLRVSVEVFSRDPNRRAQLGELLARVGFARAAACRYWGTTLALDLQPGEDDILKSFSQTARYAIRTVAKLPVQVRPVNDCGLAPRMDELSRQAFARTGAPFGTPWDWAGVIELAQRVPEATRLVGLFRTDRTGPDALLGFAWGWWNGDSVSYFAGASARPTDLRVSIGHPLLWDLIVWAKRAGATWFDLGGVSGGTARSDDPLGAISDFKRLFSKKTVEVAEDWVLEPRWLPARVATLVSSGAALLSRLRRR